MKWFLVVVALSLPVSAASAQSLSITMEPEPPRASYGRLLWAGIAGEMIGGVIGGLGGLMSLGACNNGEAYIGGFSCVAGVGYTVSASALLGASLGAAISIQRVGDAYAMGGDGWANLGATLGSFATGALVAIVGTAAFDEPTLAFIVGGGVSGVLAPFLGAFAYQDTQTPRTESASLRLVPFAAPLGVRGGQLGLMGAF